MHFPQYVKQSGSQANDATTGWSIALNTKEGYTRLIASPLCDVVNMDGAMDHGNWLIDNEFFQNLIAPDEGLAGWFTRRPRRWLYAGVSISAVLLLLYCLRCKRRRRRSVDSPESKVHKEPLQLRPAVFPDTKEFVAFCTALDEKNDVAWLQVVDEDFHLFEAFSKDIHDYYSESPSLFDNPKAGEFCVFCAPHSGDWVRGRVLAEGDNGEVEVEYVDHGKCACVSKDAVMELTRVFCYLPCKGVKCQVDAKSREAIALELKSVGEPLTQNRENLKFEFIVTDMESNPPTVAVKILPTEGTDNDLSRTIDSGIENGNNEPLDTTGNGNREPLDELENMNSVPHEETENGKDEPHEQIENGDHKPHTPHAEEATTETQDISLNFDDEPDEEYDGGHGGGGRSPARNTSTSSLSIVASPPPKHDLHSYNLKEMEVTQGKYFVRGNTSCSIVLQWTDTKCTSVSVTGSFNDWSDTPLERDEDGHFSLTVDLPLGQHRFFFRVDGQRTHDPKLPTTVEDGAILNYVSIEPLEWGRHIHVDAEPEEGSLGVVREVEEQGEEEEVKGELSSGAEKESAVVLEKMEDLSLTKEEEPDSVSANLSWGMDEDEDSS